MKTCVFCRSSVENAASICPHCRSDVNYQSLIGIPSTSVTRKNIPSLRPIIIIIETIIVVVISYAALMLFGFWVAAGSVVFAGGIFGAIGTDIINKINRDSVQYKCPGCLKEKIFYSGFDELKTGSKQRLICDCGQVSQIEII